MERASYIALKPHGFRRRLLVIEKLELAAIGRIDSFYGTAYREKLIQSRDKDDGSSLAQTSLAVLKAFVGPATLYLPHAFAQGGLLFSVPCLVAAFCLCSYGAGCLVQCWYVLEKSLPCVLNRNKIFEQASAWWVIRTDRQACFRSAWADCCAHLPRAQSMRTLCHLLHLRVPQYSSSPLAVLRHASEHLAARHVPGMPPNSARARAPAQVGGDLLKIAT